MYLLDTDTIIYALKGHEAVKENLRRHLEDPMKISIITLMELYYGAFKSEKPAGNLAKVHPLQRIWRLENPGDDQVWRAGLGSGDGSPQNR